MVWKFLGVTIAATTLLVAGSGRGGGDGTSGSGSSSSSSSSSGASSSGGSGSSSGSAPAPIKEHFTAVLRMENDLCLPERLPLVADGSTSCEVIIVLPELGK